MYELNNKLGGKIVVNAFVLTHQNTIQSLCTVYHVNMSEFSKSITIETKTSTTHIIHYTSIVYLEFGSQPIQATHFTHAQRDCSVMELFIFELNQTAAHPFSINEVHSINSDFDVSYNRAIEQFNWFLHSKHNTNIKIAFSSVYWLLTQVEKICLVRCVFFFRIVVVDLRDESK